MEQLSELEREFFKIISGWDYEEVLKLEDELEIIKAEGPIAKAAAALCERKMNEWILVKDKMPKGEVLLLTSSRTMIIGDFYNGSWRTHRSKWVEKNGKNILESAYQFQDIIAWRSIPDTMWQQFQ